MLRSLRARLVLFCVLPLVVAGVIMAPLALRAFDDYQSQRNEEALRQLQEQSAALAALYGKQVRRYFEQGGEPAPVDKELATVTGADLYYVDRLDGILPAEAVALPVLGGVDVDWDALDRGESQTLRSVALPGRDGRYLLVVTGVFTTDDPGGAEDLGAVGAFALAAPVEDLSGSGTDLFWRVAPAFAVAIVVAMLLALYLGWEVSRPLRRLVVAAGAIGRGRYDVQLDRTRRDEIGVVNRAFGDMVDRLRESQEHERLFLMRVSHELRTPLTAIRAHVQALADDVIDTEEERHDAYAVIGDEANRLGRLIGDLLDLAKLEAHRFTLLDEEVDLAAVLDHALHARREEARRHGVTIVGSFDQAPTVAGDGDRILQIVSNLLDNAVRWTPEGGVVKLDLAADAAGVRITVVDSGPGVPAAKREQVFRPFYSEDDRGTGLGLAIASELAAAMGGAIRLDDAPGGGARFTVTLPLRPAGTSVRSPSHA
jgi:signal transduction histidine kinase